MCALPKGTQQASPILETRSLQTGLQGALRGSWGGSLEGKAGIFGPYLLLLKEFRLENMKTTLPPSRGAEAGNSADEEGSRCGFHTKSLLTHYQEQFPSPAKRLCPNQAQCTKLTFIFIFSGWALKSPWVPKSETEGTPQVA